LNLCPITYSGDQKKGVKEIREKQFKDRSIKVPEGTPPVIEVEILYKSKDSLAPALMVFEPERFRIVNPKTDKPIATGTVYAYVDVDTITVRARNEYLDIQFNTKKKEPVRLCSSYLQILTNQIHTRAHRVGHEITVVFEEAARSWEYQDEWIYKLPPTRRGAGGKGGGGGQLVQISSLLSDPEQKRDMQEVEKTLDAVSGLVEGIIDKGRETNKEIVRQTEQLKKMEGMTDSSITRMQDLNVRMDKAT